MTPAIMERLSKSTQGADRVQVVVDKGSTRLVVRDGAEPAQSSCQRHAPHHVSRPLGGR